MPKAAAACPVLVERDREVALLERVASEVAGGVTQVVVVSGESGAGKSRLLTDFVGSLSGPWRKLITSGSSSRRPFADVVAGAAVGAEPPEVEIGAALAESLRPPDGRPMTVVVDDAHELDLMLIRALGVAIDILDDEPVLVLVGLRLGDETHGSETSTVVAELLRHPKVVDVEIGALSRDGVAAMASALGRSLDAAGVDDVLHRSGGNPFFVEELLLAPGAGPSWSVTETVLRRVTSAGAPATRVAELLSVAAGPLPAAVIEDLDSDGRAGTLALLRAGMAVESEDDEIVLRHALVSEVVRRHLAALDRKRLHAALAQRLEIEREPPAPDIARHWLDAGDRSRAAQWAATAADEATRARGYASASALYAIALADPPSDPIAHAQLLERAAGAAAWAGQPEALLRASAADRLYREAGEPWRAVAMWLNPRLRKLPKPALGVNSSGSDDVSSLLVESENASRAGEHSRAASIARDAFALASTQADMVWKVEAAYRLVRAGELVEGDNLLRLMFSTSTFSENWLDACTCALVLAEVAVCSGDVDRSIAYHDQALELCERAEHSTWAAEVGLALLRAARGELDLAQQHVDRAIAGGVALAAEFAELPRTWIDLEANRLGDAGVRIARMAAVRTLGVATYTMAVLLIDARRRHRLGELTTALQLLDEADRLCGDIFEPSAPDRLILRARVAAELGDCGMISEVRSQLELLVDRGATAMVPAVVDWSTGLSESCAGHREEACRRIQAAAEGLEQASRWVLAAEAWIDLVPLADAKVRDLAVSRATEICEDRRLVALADVLRRRTADTDDGSAIPSVFGALSPRQCEIALLVAEGRTNREIAEKLFLSVHTVRNQLVAIFNVLGVSRRAEIAALAAHGKGHSPTRQGHSYLTPRTPDVVS